MHVARKNIPALDQERTATGHTEVDTPQLSRVVNPSKYYIRALASGKVPEDLRQYRLYAPHTTPPQLSLYYLLVL